MPKQWIFNIFISIGLLTTGYGNGHGIVLDGSLIVTDVTPVQFCVVWVTSEPAYGWVKVSLDPEGKVPCREAEVTFESAEYPPAENLGVMKVRVTGLKPDTEYFFQAKSTTKNDGIEYLSPLNRLRTEKNSVIVRNDLLAYKVSIGDNTPAPGTLVIASVENASHPISGWVGGGGVPEQWGAIDTNNFYGRNTSVNLEVEGGEVINLTLLGGSLGSVETQETVPEETGTMQELKTSARLLDSQSGLTASVPQNGVNGSEGSGGGSGCFISAASGGMWEFFRSINRKSIIWQQLNKNTGD